MANMSKEKKYGSMELPKVEISVPTSQTVETPPQSAHSFDAPIKEVTRVVYQAERRRLPSERQAIVHKFLIGDQEGFLTVGLYDDGTPGEIFVRLTKIDASISGLLDAFAMTTSVALQYGVPLESLITKLVGLSFEPAGKTINPTIPDASSIIDYICRWLALRFLSPEALALLGLTPKERISNEQLMLNSPEGS